MYVVTVTMIVTCFLYWTGCIAEFQTFQNQPLTYTWTWGELIVIVTGKAEAFIYKSTSYNDVRQYDMLGEKLSQLNDKA